MSLTEPAPPTHENRETWRDGTTREVYHPWHKWFAWRPVLTTDRGIVWLRFVRRRRVFHNPPPAPSLPGSFYAWEYQVQDFNDSEKGEKP